MRLFYPDETPDEEVVDAAERLGLTTWDVEQLAWEERDWWRQEAEFKRAQDRP